MKRIRIATFAALCLLVAVGFAQQTPKGKSHAFQGKVEKVNEDNQTLTVNHGNIEGWMGAMTMAYGVDDPAVLKKVKVGDRIKATVYDDDYMLYKVEVVPPGGDEKSKKKK